MPFFVNKSVPSGGGGGAGGCGYQLRCDNGALGIATLRRRMYVTYHARVYLLFSLYLLWGSSVGAASITPIGRLLRDLPVACGGFIDLLYISYLIVHF